jgi:hypothetical protein
MNGSRKIPNGRNGHAELPVVDEKYSKTRRKKKQSVRGSVPHMAGLVALFTLILFLWNISMRSIRNRKLRDVKERYKRAEEILKDRDNLMPHADRHGKVGNGQKLLRLAAQELSGLPLKLQFEKARLLKSRDAKKILRKWMDELDNDVVKNIAGGIRWIRPYLLPSGDATDDPPEKGRQQDDDERKRYFRVRRTGTPMAWEEEWEQMVRDGTVKGPIVDYTDPSKYVYPKLESTPPSPKEYPPLQPLAKLIENWPQDEDFTGTIHEGLMHFNFSDPEEMAMATRFRDAEVPFKVYAVPELTEATKKWTDEYVSDNFFSRTLKKFQQNMNPFGAGAPQASGTAQESPNNYFAFFTSPKWNTDDMGVPPVRNNDFDFARWAKHAKYADSARLPFDKPHFYWQSGVDREERYKSKEEWTFISKDLPSLSSPTQTFFVFHPDEQKGIQCRFGERGVVAATHYDGGRNSIAMVTGAKRYILSPPRECSKLGIFTNRKSPIYRHSLLNFAHIKFLDSKEGEGMSQEERTWLEKASKAQSIETVLKAGEALYIPSHWFHYIVSLQKSAQCNVRSGIDHDGSPAFGGRETVETCTEWSDN